MEDLNAIKSLVEASRDSRGFARLNAETKRRVIAYVTDRRDRGERLEDVAAEVGVAKSSLQRWSHGRSAKGTMRAVKIGAPAATFVVRAPRGVVVEGMSIEDLAELVRRLS